MSFESQHSYVRFRRFVQNHSRYIFDEESKSFLKGIEVTCIKRVITLPVTQSLWRAQVGCNYRPLLENDSHIDDLPIPFENERMSPRKNSASEGRANPKGIPYLYVAIDKETAMSEVRPSLGAILSVGSFKPIKELKIVDFSDYQKKRKLYFKEPSKVNAIDVVWSDMNRAFSIPVSNSNLTSDYVPTQIIAELIKSLGYDGIAYVSSLAKGKNIVLFDIGSALIENCNIYKASQIDYGFNEELNQFSPIT